MIMYLVTCYARPWALSRPTDTIHMSQVTEQTSGQLCTYQYLRSRTSVPSLLVHNVVQGLPGDVPLSIPNELLHSLMLRIHTHTVAECMQAAPHSLKRLDIQYGASALRKVVTKLSLAETALSAIMAHLGRTWQCGRRYAATPARWVCAKQSPKQDLHPVVAHLERGGAVGAVW